MKKFFSFLGKLIVFMIIVNLLLAVIARVFHVTFEAASVDKLVVPQDVYVTLFKGQFYEIPINQTLVGSWVVMAILIVTLKIGTRKLSVENPGRFQLLLEMFYSFVENTFVATYGKYKKRYIPFFAAMFSFILFSNLLAFLLSFVPIAVKEESGWLIKPLFRTPTADINTTGGLAILVVIIFLGTAFKNEGVLGYFKGLAKPIPFMFPINLIGEVAKPINTSMRLFGNMFAGIVIIGLLYSLTSSKLIGLATNNTLQSAFSFSIGWVAFLHVYFDLFAGVIQAFVFTVLSSVYISETLGHTD